MSAIHLNDKTKHILSIIQSILIISGVHISNDEQLIFGLLVGGNISQDKINRIKAILGEP